MGSVLWHIGNRPKLRMLLVNVAVLVDRGSVDGGISHIVSLWSNHTKPQFWIVLLDRLKTIDQPVLVLVIGSDQDVRFKSRSSHTGVLLGSSGGDRSGTGCSRKIRFVL